MTLILSNKNGKKQQFNHYDLCLVGKWAVTNLVRKKTTVSLVMVIKYSIKVTIKNSNPTSAGTLGEE